jgi:Fe-Mn family superoxide dismutase
MKPNGGGDKIPGALKAKIDSDLGGVAKAKEDFIQAGVTQFGSGWAWLVEEGGKLKVTKTPNADLPMKHKQKALLTMDVWEHAYYVDYRNERERYVSAILERLNWEFAEKNL